MSDAEIMAEAYNVGGGGGVGPPPPLPGEKIGDIPPRPSSMSPGSKPPTPIGPRRLSGIMDLSATGPDPHPVENGVHGSPYPSLLSMTGSSPLNNGSSSAGSKLACRYCGKTFSQAGYIKAHERLHTGEKPFSCSVCGKRFSDPSNWKKHERVHANQARKTTGHPSPGDMGHKLPEDEVRLPFWWDKKRPYTPPPNSGHKVSRPLLDGMEEVPSLIPHLENGDGPHRPPLLPEHMMMDGDAHFTPHPRHHHPPPGPVFHHASQLPPFSSIVPFRTPTFPAPLNIFTTQPLSLTQPADFTSGPLFQPGPALALPAPLKVMEMPPSPGIGDSEVVSTTTQLKKYGSESHMATAVSTPEGQQEPMVQGDGEGTICHPPSNESSDTGSQSPEEGVEVNGDELVPAVAAAAAAAKRAIERQNLNTRMMGAGSSRKQRHPMRRFSSASSEQETPQSTSSLATSSLSSTTRESRDLEDQGLVAYLINKGRVYKCEHCRIIFDDCTLYLLHNGFHSHDAQPFRCGICRAICHDRIEFNCHLTSHINSPAQNGAMSDGGT